MNTFTKLLSIFLCLTLILGSLFACTRKDQSNPEETKETSSQEEETTSQEEPEEENAIGLEYFPLSDGTFGIKGGAAKYLEEIVIPSTYQEKAVTKILEEAFKGSDGVKSITLPESITSIGKSAFADCTSLEAIEIPQSVTEIGASAFAGCTSLEAIELPQGVTKIGASTFAGCTSLEDLEIPQGVTEIGAAPLAGCTNLTNLTIPFVGASLTPANDPSDPYFDWFSTSFEYLFTTDPNNYFDRSDCPKSITTLKIMGGTLEGSFSNPCQLQIKNLILGADVSYIPPVFINPFSSWNPTITIEDGNRKYHSDGNCVIESASKTIIYMGSNGVIPSDGSVTKIGMYAFYNYYSKRIIIPNCITSIHEDAFRYNWDGFGWSISDIYFTGSEEEWNALESKPILPTYPEVTIHYNY